MKTMRMVLSALTLLGLTAVGFAADVPPASPTPTESRVHARVAAETPRPADTTPTQVSVRNECVDGIRMPGLYMGPDGVMHHVPKMQSCAMNIW